jgi:hypothetical protein
MSFFECDDLLVAEEFLFGRDKLHARSKAILPTDVDPRHHVRKVFDDLASYRSLEHVLIPRLGEVGQARDLDLFVALPHVEFAPIAVPGFLALIDGIPLYWPGRASTIGREPRNMVLVAFVG